MSVILNRAVIEHGPNRQHNIVLPLLDDVRTSGKGVAGRTELLDITELRHLRVETEAAELSEVRDVEMLTSRWIDREPGVGFDVHLSDGWFSVEKCLIGGGAYIAVLKAHDGEGRKIVCRGTAARRSATGWFDTIINDLLVDVGMRGVMAVWGEMKDFLQKEGIEEVEVLGKSMGGAQAQMLAALIANKTGTRVTALKTFASVSVPEFVGTVLQEKSPDTRVLVVRTGDDYIPLVGGVHAGNDMNDTTIMYIGLEENPGLETEGLSGITLAWRFLRSFFAPHKQQTTSRDTFFARTVDDEGKARELRVGMLFEGARVRLAGLLSHLVDQRRFEDFYDDPTT